jgi:hypothetical protein
MVLMGFGSGFVMPTLGLVSQNAVAHRFIGVASGARQFFMQIGGTVGLTIFGVVLTTSYQHSFADGVSQEARAAIPAPILARFDDPTLALNEVQFAAVSREVLSLGGGQRLLEETVNAQRAGVAVAIHHIYWGATAFMAIAFACTLALKGIPLRRGSQPVRSGVPAGASREPAPLSGSAQAPGAGGS